MTTPKTTKKNAAVKPAVKNVRKPATTNKKADSTNRAKLAFGLVNFNLEAANVVNMLFMSRGDNYVAYANAVGKTDYPSLRLALVEDLSTAPTKIVKEGDKSVTYYPWGKMSIAAKAHSLAVSIKKTVETRKLKFNQAGKAVDANLFAKFDKKEKKEVTKVKTVTQKSVFKPFDTERAMAFLAKFA
jgi:hypothetical protein